MMTDQPEAKTANSENRRRTEELFHQKPLEKRHQSRNSHFWFETMNQGQTQAEPGKPPQRQTLRTNAEDPS